MDAAIKELYAKVDMGVPISSKYKDGKLIFHKIRVKFELNKFIIIRLTDGGEVDVTYLIDRSRGTRNTVQMTNVIEHLTNISSTPYDEMVDNICSDYVTYHNLIPHVTWQDHVLYFDRFAESSDGHQIFDSFTNDEKNNMFYDTYELPGNFYNFHVIPHIVSMMQKNNSPIFDEYFIKNLFLGNFEKILQYAPFMTEDTEICGIPIDLVLHHHKRLDLIPQFDHCIQSRRSRPLIPDDYDILSPIVTIFTSQFIIFGLTFTIDLDGKTVSISHSGSVTVGMKKNDDILSVTIYYPEYQEMHTTTSTFSYEGITKLAMVVKS